MMPNLTKRANLEKNHQDKDLPLNLASSPTSNVIGTGIEVGSIDEQSANMDSRMTLNTL